MREELQNVIVSKDQLASLIKSSEVLTHFLSNFLAFRAMVLAEA